MGISDYRNLALIIVSNAIVGSMMPMLIILGGLAGLVLAWSPNLATLPASVQMLGSLVAATPMSLFMGRHGRRLGFLVGTLLALVGGGLGFCGLYFTSFFALLVGHFVLGAALSSFQFFRFAAGEAVPAQWQSVAISLVMSSGLVAAFVGPEIFARTRDAFDSLPFAGAYGAIAVLALIGAFPLWFVRMPLGDKESRLPVTPLGSVAAIIRRADVGLAILAGAIAQGAMVALMAPTTLAMIGFGYHETHAADVIRWHVIAMFAPSFFTGFIIRRVGAFTTVQMGLGFLIVASVIATSEVTLWAFYVSMVILGVGWNFSFIGATSLLSSALVPGERAAVQGVNDTIIALSSMVCAFASGAIVISYGWSVLALLLLPVVSGVALSLAYYHSRALRRRI